MGTSKPKFNIGDVLIRTRNDSYFLGYYRIRIEKIDRWYYWSVYENGEFVYKENNTSIATLEDYFILDTDAAKILYG